jgi:hypothetical protein
LSTPPLRSRTGCGGKSLQAQEHAYLLPMPPAKYNRFPVTSATHRSPRQKIGKARQAICAPIKWACFLLNFLIFLLGLTCLTLGIYLCVKDPRPITEWTDVALNPAIVLTLSGLSICVVSLCGLFGALRDNVFLLKTFALCVFFSYILLVVCTFVLFMLFYSDTSEGLSAHSILLSSIRKYHTNRNVADFVDYLQEQLECCGVSSMSQGFRDWHTSEQFQCNQSNPYPEKCGVPFSCCRRQLSEAAGSGGSFPNIRSLECWQNAQAKRVQELENDIYVRGCLGPLRTVFESHAIHLGAAVAIFILPVCLGVCLSHVLARQIGYQRYLLAREERRFERRQRREQREQQRVTSSLPSAYAKDEQSMELGKSAVRNPKKLPNFPPPPVPPDNLSDAAKRALAEAKDRERQRRRERRRAVSSSPQRSGGEVVSTNTNGVIPADKAIETGERSNRRRSASNLSAMPNSQQMPSRTRQWILQQAHFSGKDGDAVKVGK